MRAIHVVHDTTRMLASLQLQQQPSHADAAALSSISDSFDGEVLHSILKHCAIFMDPRKGTPANRFAFKGECCRE